MSVIPKTIRPMRIIALPLTRAAVLSRNHDATNTSGSSNPPLTFYHFQLKSPPAAGEEDRKQSEIKSLVQWVSTKAADTWAGFGKAPEGSWKVRNLYLFCWDLMDMELTALCS